MSIVSTIIVGINRAVGAWQRRRERLRTRRIVESLPRRIRKDIGWPSRASRFEVLPDR